MVLAALAVADSEGDGSLAFFDALEETVVGGTRTDNASWNERLADDDTAFRTGVFPNNAVNESCISAKANLAVGKVLASSQTMGESPVPQPSSLRSDGHGYS